MAYNKSFGATAYLTFNDKQIALTAENIKSPRLVYHAESFYTAVSLGKLNDAITSISKKMESVIDSKTAEEIVSEVNNLSGMPVLGEILESELVITDFVIDHSKEKYEYEFGLGLRLTGDKKLGPVALDGISINVKATQK